MIYKKFSKILINAFSILLSLNSVTYTSQDIPPLVILAESYPPYEFIQNKEVLGIDIDILNAIFGNLTIPFKVSIMPWPRAWEKVKQGKVDGTLSVSLKEDRVSTLNYPQEELWLSHFVFFVRRNEQQETFESYQDAKNLVVGIIRGNSYEKEFWKANLKTFEAPDIETAFRMLAAGRVDLVLADKTMGLYTLKMLNLGQDLIHYKKIMFTKKYFFTSVRQSKYPNLEKIFERFHQELSLFKKTQQYQDIITKWTGVTETP